MKHRLMISYTVFVAPNAPSFKCPVSAGYDNAALALVKLAAIAS